MSFTSRSPQPSLVWQFQSSNVETITGLAPTFSTTSGSLTSAPTYVTGKTGQAISFSNETAGAGANSYITYSLSSSFSPTSFTWAYWVNYRQIPVQSFQTPLYFTDSLASTTDFAIAIGPAGAVPGNGQQPFIFGSGSFLLAPALSQGVWRHFCIVLTPGSGGSTATWYSDGTLVGSTVFTNNQTATINGMSVGARFIPGTGASEGAICYVDDLRLFNRALTAAQVQAVYASQGVYAGNITFYNTGGGIVSPITGATSMNRIYSIQRVNKTYSGNIINLRRSSDSANVDFVTDSTNTNLVTASGAQTLASWLGAASANTVIWYDQSGNGRNLVQTTSTLQPGFSATTGVQFRSLLYMAFPDNCAITDGTILTGFIQNAYLRGNPADAWYFQDGIIPGERPGGTDDWGLLLNGSAKFGVGAGPSDAQCSISTNGLGTYSFMTVTRVSSTGAITLYNGTGSGSAFTLATGSKTGPTPTLMGWNQPNNLQYMNADMASLFWFDDVKSGTFISSVASTFTTQKVPNLDAVGNGIVSLTGKSLFSQLSPTVVNSVAAAFSLRAVNETTAKAVQVIKLYGLWPPIGMTSDSFTATGTYNGIVNGVYTSSASSYYVASGTEQPWRAFDKNNNGTWWTIATLGYSSSTGLYTAGLYSTTISGSSYAGEWIQIQLPASVTVTSYTIYNSASWNSRAPVDFKLAGSNDGSTWTLVDTQTAITSWISSTTNITFLPSTPGAYSYYRLCVNKTGGGASGQYLSIGEIILQTGTTQDFYADSRGNLLTAPITGQTLASWLGGAAGYVTTWYDQSGAGNHATQITAANQPIIQKASKGPGYSCLFSGAQYLTGASYTVLNATNYTISMVERKASSTTNDMGIVTWGFTGSTNGELIIIYRNSTAFIYAQFANDIQATVSAYNAGSEPVRYSFGLCSSTSGRNLYIYNDPLGNPIQTQDVTKTAQLSMTTGNMQIGQYTWTGGGPSYYIGEIFEILVFKTSAYDTDGTTGTNVPTTVQNIYNNQFAYYT